MVVHGIKLALVRRGGLRASPIKPRQNFVWCVPSIADYFAAANQFGWAAATAVSSHKSIRFALHGLLFLLARNSRFGNASAILPAAMEKRHTHPCVAGKTPARPGAAKSARQGLA
jgi:hypothetical protein